MTEKKENPFASKVNEPLRTREAKIESIKEECGISKQTFYNWMNGVYQPGKNDQAKIANILGCPVKDIFPNAGKEVENV